MAAKHTGHCQICGRQHKVTGKRIAKHGYTIRHGWQEGACFGSDGQPYELSNDLLLKGIDGAKAYIERTEQLLAKLAVDPLAEREGSDLILATVSVNYQQEQRLVRIVLNENGRVEARDSYDHPCRLYDSRAAAAKTVEAAQRHLADVRIGYLQMTVRQAQESIEYMQERHDSWKPMPLAEISPADLAAKAPKVHLYAMVYGYASTACSGSAMAARRNMSRDKTHDATKLTCTSCIKRAKARAEKAAKKALESQSNTNE